jgi:hypothetical protein
MIEEMKKLVEPFNEMMKEQVRKKFNDAVGYLVEQIRCNGQKDKGISLYSTTLEYQSDYLYEWRKFAWEQGNVESSVAIEFYRNNVDMFINYDAMDDYVEELADEYGVDDVALFIQGGCRIYMGNPYYEEGFSNRPTAFEIYCKELENVKDGQYVILADCGDGGVLIGKDGKYGFDDLDHAVFIRDEHRFDNSVEVSVYLVQKCMDEYGVVTNELIKCVE